MNKILRNIRKTPKRRPEKPIRMPVSGVFKIRGAGDVITVVLNKEH